jgi:hypothetical protein
MRFNSLDEFLKHYYENNVNIVDVEFNFDAVNTEDPSVTPDVVEEPVEEPIVGEEPQKLEEKVTLQLPSGDVTITIDAEGFMVVEDFAMTPNACGTGFIVVEGRKLHLDMCEMEGKTVAYLPTAKGHKEPISVRRQK